MIKEAHYHPPLAVLRQDTKSNPKRPLLNYTLVII